MHTGEFLLYVPKGSKGRWINLPLMKMDTVRRMGRNKIIIYLTNSLELAISICRLTLLTISKGALVVTLML